MPTTIPAPSLLASRRTTGLRLLAPEDDDSAPAAAAAHPRPDETALPTDGPHRVDDAVGRRRAEPAVRVAGMRRRHQVTEDARATARDGLLEYPQERLDAHLLLDRVERRSPDRVLDRGLDRAHLVVDAVAETQELGARHALGKPLGLHVPWAKRSQVVGFDAEQGFSHERGAARSPVGRIADGMPRAGVDPPDGEPGGQCEGADDLGRPAKQRQDVRFLAVGCRHLVHRSARRARDELLRAVSEQREATRLELVAERTGRRLRDGDLDRSRGTETLALRHRRGKEEPQPGDGEPLLSGQQRDRSQHICGPRVLARKAAGQLIERQLDEVGGRDGDAPAPADCDDHSVGGVLCGGQHGLPDREAEDEPTGIVGDAAKDVKASRRPGDDHRLLGHELRVIPHTHAERVGVGEAPARDVTPQHLTRRGDHHFERVSQAFRVRSRVKRRVVDFH